MQGVKSWSVEPNNTLKTKMSGDFGLNYLQFARSIGPCSGHQTTNVTHSQVNALKQFVKYADIITLNLGKSCFKNEIVGTVIFASELGELTSTVTHLPPPPYSTHSRHIFGELKKSLIL